MGIISIEHIDRLFWLGRYTERTYTTIKMFEVYFDRMIDLEADMYEDYCRKQEIPNIYSSSEEFSRKYCFDEEDPNSIYSNLMRGYDNAIVLREEIGSETLAYIQLAVYEMNKARISKAPLIELQKVNDNIAAFWGIADDSIDSECVRNIIKMGKRIERIDIYARMHMKREEIVREVSRLSSRIKSTGLKYDESIIEKMQQLVKNEKIDYPELLRLVESIYI